MRLGFFPGGRGGGLACCFAGVLSKWWNNKTKELIFLLFFWTSSYRVGSEWGSRAYFQKFEFKEFRANSRGALVRIVCSNSPELVRFFSKSILKIGPAEVGLDQESGQGYLFWNRRWVEWSQPSRERFVWENLRNFLSRSPSCPAATSQNQQNKSIVIYPFGKCQALFRVQLRNYFAKSFTLLSPNHLLDPLPLSSLTLSLFALFRMIKDAINLSLKNHLRCVRPHRPTQCRFTCLARNL